MPRFVVNEPVKSARPTIEVEGLPLGRHRFELVVVNGAGKESAPVEMVVTVSRDGIVRPPVPPIPPPVQ
jgi:hypothetical protein